MSDIVGHAQILLSANTARFEQDIRQATETANAQANRIKSSFDSMGKMAKIGFGAITAAAGLANSAVAVMVADQVKLANEVSRLAAISPATTQQMQYWAVGAKKSGIEMDKLSDIFKDTSDKVGEFLSSGGGEMKDFFTKVAPKVGVTAQQFRNLSGPDALQLYYNTLEKANLNQQEMTFYMEAVADEATGLIPILKNGGAELNKWGEIAKQSGAIMSDDLIANAKEMSNQVDIMTLRWEGFKNKLTGAVLPELIALSTEMNKTGGVIDTVSQGASTALSGLANWMMTDAPHQFSAAVGVVAVGAMAKFGGMAVATVPSLLASGGAMFNNARAAIANATSTERLATALLHGTTVLVDNITAMSAYARSMGAGAVNTVNFVRNLPAVVSGLKAQATQAAITARSMATLATAQNTAINGTVLAARGVMGMGSALGSLGSLINKHPLMILGGIIATVVVGTKGLKGAMESLGDAASVTGILFEDFAKGAVEGIGFLANDAMNFFNSFTDNSQTAATNSDNAFGGMFKNTEGGFVGIMQVSARVFDKIGSHVRASMDFAVVKTSNAMTAIHNGFIHLGNGIKAVAEFVVNTWIDKINFVLQGVNTLISATNNVSSMFGGTGTNISPVTLIQNVNLGRTETLTYDNKTYAQSYDENKVSTLSDGLDGAIARQKNLKTATQATTGAVNAQAFAHTNAGNAAKVAGDKADKATKDTAASAKKQADYQLMVYNAWKKAGLSEQQSKVLTAEVGRENAYNPATLFGYHKDAANGKINVGMLSWQKERGKELEGYLRAVGVMHGNTMEKSQESLNAMAQFAVKEIMTMKRFTKTKTEFLANKDIETQKAFAITGDNYIAWDRSGKAVLGAAGAAKHAARRDNYYRQISAKVGVGSTADDGNMVQAYQDQLKDQEKLEKQQAESRLQIERETADGVTKINLDLQEKLEKVKQAGFDPAKQKQLEEYYKNDAQAQIAQFEQAQKQKISAFTEFKKTEFEKITEEMTASINNVKWDNTLTESQKQLAYKAIEEEATYKLKVVELNRVKEQQALDADHQTAIERIKIESAIKRREITLNLQLTEDARQAQIQEVDEQEQEALRQTRLDFEKELAGITDYSVTEMQRLRAEYKDERSKLDRRTDISPEKKSDLRNALAGKEIYSANQIKKPAADAFNNLNAEMSGTTAYYQLEQDYKAKLDIVKKYEQAHTDEVEKAEKAKSRIEMSYAQASYQLHVGYATGIAGTVADMGKAMFSETSRTYKLLFGISQSFVMAQAGLNMWKAISDGWATGATLPQKLAAAAVAGTEMLKVINAAQQVKMQGFASGGYTGDIPTNAVAGLVHGGEYVFDAEATKTLGRKNLDSLRKGDGMMGNTTINVNVNVNSDGSSNVESDKQLGKSIGEAVNIAVQKALLKERRQGGMLGAR